MRLDLLLTEYQPFSISRVLFMEMNKINVEEYIREDSNRKTEFISWSIAQYLFIKFFPTEMLLTPVVLLSEYNLPYHQLPLQQMSLADEPGLVESTACGGFVCTALVNPADKLYTGLVWSPIMAKNKMNPAILIPNAREIADATQRCMVKSIATATGIGFVLYSQFEFDNAEGSALKSEKKPTSFRTQPKEEEEVEEVEDEYFDDDDDKDTHYSDAPKQQSRKRPSQPRFGGSLRGRV